MHTSLDQELDALPEAARQALTAHHFHRERFLNLAAAVREGRPFQNHVSGSLAGPRPGDWVALPPAESEEGRKYLELGREALRKGQCALVVLAGGMATRMGGVVKALVPALPGKTFLDLRLGEQQSIARQFGSVPPLWLMTSQATTEKTRQALGKRLDGYTIADFPQGLAPRLTSSGNIFLDAEGQPSLYATGHGDLPEALQASGLLQRFVSGGGRVVMVTNLDNLGGTLDPLTIGFHLAHGCPVTSEVVDKLAADRGGIPVRLDEKLVVLEEFRIPPGFDPSTVPVFNTNVFHFDARTLLELKMPWTYFKVEKKVGEARYVQFERLINEVTSYLETRYVHMPRIGEASRFLPCKDMEELALRQPEILAVAQSRGMI
ncbi:MAG: UTP--glucose-1-phosphate uridylyltransferase [Polyangiaceae bacterium]|nr:UTP--glucose-1-phosphate uridylyltransferase [Polyangiaceae bacterium]